MMIVCDWGSSRLRAYRVEADGKVADRHESDQGVKALGGREEGFRGELDALRRRFGAGDEVPIRISGMAGARGGWVETDYAPVPAGVDSLVGNYVSLPGYADARLYGGLVFRREDGSVDVMRGEEVQVIGLLTERPDATLICLPGTHSKWVRVEGGRLTRIRTFMTGDLFHALGEHSIFAGQITSTAFSREGFEHGCDLAAEGAGLDDLFRLRTEFVFGRVGSDAFHSCLSGFLIANELRAARVVGMTDLCGAGPLTRLYALALEKAGISSRTVDAETATIRGHLELFRSS